MSHRKEMNIAFFGSSLVSAYWNGAATYYRGVIRALAARGHRITFFEPDAFDRQANRDMEPPPWAAVVVYPATLEGADRVLREALDADLVIKASGVGVLDEYLEAAVVDQRRPRQLVAFWDVDAPATLDRLERDPTDPFRNLVPCYDIVFTYGGGPPVVRGYEGLGARYCVPIYNAVDPETHHPVRPRSDMTADLSFLGNRLPDREARVAEFFLRPAGALPERQFLLGGNGWDAEGLPGNVRYLGHVSTRDHNEFNASPLAVLNVSRESMARYGHSPATRVFEAAGAGACLISDGWEGLERFLEPGREVLVAHDGEEVAAQLSALDRSRARAVGDAARRRILAEHTYAHRARDVERALDTTETARPRPRRPAASRLDIVILGLSITSSWGNGHATTYRALVRELRARGHSVLFLERDLPWYASNRDLPKPPFGQTEIYESTDELRARFANRIRQADAVIVGSYVPDGVEVGRWVTENAGGVTAFYDIDTPVTLSKLEAGDADYISRDLVSKYDLYLSFTGGPILDRLKREFRARRALPLYCSVDPELYGPCEVPRRWDLSYMGTYTPDREEVLERLLIAPARSWTPGRFIVAGPQYPPSIEWPSNVERMNHVSPRDHRKFYGASSYTLNVTRAQMTQAGHSPSVRLFEAAACATPVISDYWPGLESLFEPDREILIARSSEDVLRYLRDVGASERRALGERARKRVLHEHTAYHRAVTLERYLMEGGPGAREGLVSPTVARSVSPVVTARQRQGGNP